jgi:hypothetical protein
VGQLYTQRHLLLWRKQRCKAFKLGLGCPDTWIDYSTFDVVRGDAYGNMRRAEAFNRSRNLTRLKGGSELETGRSNAREIEGYTAEYLEASNPLRQCATLQGRLRDHDASLLSQIVSAPKLGFWPRWTPHRNRKPIRRRRYKSRDNSWLEGVVG